MLPKGLLKEHSRVLSMVARLLDMLAVILAGCSAYFLKFGCIAISLPYSAALAMAAGLTLVVFSFFHIYRSVRTQSYWQHINRLSQGVLAVVMILAGLAFLTKTGESYSRSWFIIWAFLALFLLVFFRVSVLMALHLLRAQGWNERRVIVIGAGQLGRKLAELLDQSHWTGFRIVAFFDDVSDKTTLAGIPVLRTPENISDYLLQSPVSIDEIWLALPLRAEKRVKELLYALRHHTQAVRLAMDIFGLDLLGHSITDLGGFPLLNLNESPMVGTNRIIKAIEDRLFAVLILILISPVLLIIAIGVKLSSKGPILFKQQRHGWDGRIMRVYKFRTMYEHHEIPGQVTQATIKDVRITPFGRLLRRTSLDELPQFYNVLQGKMSIVGPRPHAVAHNELYKDSIKAYMQRHKVKPGITGWAQVNGWRGETEALDKMKKRVEYDLFYIENWSLALDLKIILLTIFRGFISKNAY